MSGGSYYDKEVMEWVMDEVVINTNYNHVVICSNKSYNSYKIIFILHEYIYAYINHFLTSLSSLPACSKRKHATTI